MRKDYNFQILYPTNLFLYIRIKEKYFLICNDSFLDKIVDGCSRIKPKSGKV